MIEADSSIVSIDHRAQQKNLSDKKLQKRVIKINRYVPRAWEANINMLRVRCIYGNKSKNAGSTILIARA